MLQNQLPALQASISKSKKKIAELESFKDNLDGAKERINEVARQIEKIQRQVPADVNDTVVQSLLSEEAKELNIQNFDSKPGKETLNGFYFTKEYDAAGMGTFLQALIFFERLAKQERVLNIKKMTLKVVDQLKKSRYQMLNMSFILESYRYNQAHRESTGIEEIEREFSQKKTPRGKK
jgi:Tfp pilus assembly protein PilO